MTAQKFLCVCLIGKASDGGSNRKLTKTLGIKKLKQQSQKGYIPHTKVHQHVILISQTVRPPLGVNLNATLM